MTGLPKHDGAVSTRTQREPATRWEYFGHLKMTLRFEADTTTATIIADTGGNPVIKIESHR